MKTTVFTKYHIAAGAKMAEFAGYNMPIEFTGINDEHMAVRNGAGVFDVSHMGEIWVKGPRALDLLQRITTNDVSKLFDGKVQYTCMPNGRGGIVDDILVYRVDAETYMLCVNAANIDKDWKHICAEGKAFGMEAGHGRELYNASDEICQLAVQGPLAMKIVQKMEAGEEFGLKNIGRGARDTLRLEKGFCLYGNDIDDTTSPLEAGLGWITKFAEGKDFIDRAAMERLKAEGVGRKLVGLKMVERGIPRHGYAIAAPDGTEIGHVTSGTMSPCMKVGFGLGYVTPEYAKAGTEIAVVVREKPLRAEVVKIPFV